MSCVYPSCMMGGGACDFEEKCIQERQSKNQSELDQLKSQLQAERERALKAEAAAAEMRAALREIEFDLTAYEYADYQVIFRAVKIAREALSNPAGEKVLRVVESARRLRDDWDKGKLVMSGCVPNLIYALAELERNI